MKLFLDSADLAEIQRFVRWRVLDGVTTTPTFFRRLGRQDATGELRQLVQSFAGEIHVEALGDTVADIMDAARRNHEIGPRMVSKIPVGALGIEATSRLVEEGIRVNLHLVFSVNQAVMAAKAGAQYVCPLMGRLHDAGLDGLGVLSDIVTFLAAHPEFETVLMASSIRTVEDARRAFLSGAGAVTIPGHVLGRILDSPLTDRAHAILSTDSVAVDSVAERMRPLERLPMVEPDDPPPRLMREMTLKAIGIVVVVERGRLLGVVTDGDLRRALQAAPDEDRVTARTIMTETPKCVRPDDAVGTALDLMRTHRLTEVIVVDDADAPLGLLNLHDLMASSANP